MSLLVVEHPLVRERLTQLRDRNTEPPRFRRLLGELGSFLAYEAMRDLPTRTLEIETPIGQATGTRIARPPVLAPVLRAGLGFLDAFLNLVPHAEVAHLGFFRDPATLEAVPYYAHLPAQLAGVEVFVLDPMLATGHSALAALGVLRARGADTIAFVCAIAAADGVAAVQDAYPQVRIVTAAVDEHLNGHAYIVPGLGDAGDRLYGTTDSLPASYRRATSA